MAVPVDPPIFRCVQVGNNGTGTLIWTPPADPTNSFAQYEVYYSSNVNGPYALGPFIGNINQQSSPFNNVNLNNQPIHFIIGSRSIDGSISYSDTLCSIHLSLINTSTAGVAELVWNPLSSSQNLGGWYKIYRQYQAVRTLLDSVPYGVNLYNDTVSFCADSAYYQIFYEGATCDSWSNIVGDSLKDRTPPTPPEIKVVSVDTATNSPVIDWYPSPELDTEGYNVFNNNGGWFFLPPVVYGRLNNTYTHTSSNVSTQKEVYSINAFDSCAAFGSSPPSVIGNLPHQTIYIETQLNKCDRNITLNWNRYINWPDGVLRYELYALQQGIPPTLIHASGNDTSFVHQNIISGETYCYVVKAISGNASKFSLSNKTCTLVDYPAEPSFNYLTSADILADNQVELRLFVDTSVDVREYVIERRISPAVPFQLIGTVNPTGSPNLTYQDFDVSTNIHSYYYRCTVIDSCGNESLTSTINKTILLSAAADSERRINRLSWSAYEGWQAIGQYYVYRSINGVFDPIAIISGNRFQYDDDISQFYEAQGEFCYYVQAREINNAFGFNEVAKSNQACVKQEQALWIPNAFIPNGINKEFKPVGNFLSYKNYQFTIFNRWGEIVFETDEPNIAWNGRINNTGNLAQTGVFVYQIKYENAKGEKFKREGSVTLLRN